jgi:hypothetical protein
MERPHVEDPPVGHGSLRNWKPETQRAPKRRRLRRFQVAVIGSTGVLAGLIASSTTAFAHHIVSTAPNPTSAVLGTQGLSLKDSANVSDATTDRDVTFWLWAPGECEVNGKTPVFTDTEEITQAGSSTVTTTSGFTPTQIGTYQWTAAIIVDATSQIEDATNAKTKCGDEPVDITGSQPEITTTASDGGTVGIGLTDTATVTGGNNPAGPVTFYLYGPDNKDCNSQDGWLMKWTEPLVNGLASIPSKDAFATTKTGIYHWIAVLTADANNASDSTECAEEPVVVSKAQPTIKTTTSKAGPVGTKIFDSAKVSDGFNPTGTVTFELFAPGDPTCDETPVQTVTVALKNDGTASSSGSPFTTTKVGTYHWIAEYNGDDNNREASSKCADEPQASGKASVTIDTTPSAGGTTKTTITDTATVSGGVNPTGTVTFVLYGPGDNTCTTAIFTSADKPLNNGVALSDGFSGTTTAGTYSWVATYSGDKLNSAASSACGAETVVITKPTSGVQGIGSAGVPATGANIPFRLAVGLLILGAGLTVAASAEVFTRRRRMPRR